mgnify:CR=1 FL=1
MIKFRYSAIDSKGELVEDEQGVHILQLTNRRPAVNRTLDSARRQITSTLLRQKKDNRAARSHAHKLAQVCDEIGTRCLVAAVARYVATDRKK